MLTAQQLASIVAADLTPDTLGNELRRARRFQYHGQILIQFSEADSQPEAISVLDISARGLRIVHPTEFQRGASFVAQLPRYQTTPLRVLCTVAHCQPRANGLFTVGVEFTCVLSEPGATDERAQERIRRAILTHN
jgi:PilZ domain-containing protein